MFVVLISTELHLSIFSAQTISSDKMSIDISDTLELLNFVKKMSEHRYQKSVLIRIRYGRKTGPPFPDARKVRTGIIRICL